MEFQSILPQFSSDAKRNIRKTEKAAPFFTESNLQGRRVTSFKKEESGSSRIFEMTTKKLSQEMEVTIDDEGFEVLKPKVSLPSAETDKKRRNENPLLSANLSSEKKSKLSRSFSTGKFWKGTPELKALTDVIKKNLNSRHHPVFGKKDLDLLLSQFPERSLESFKSQASRIKIDLENEEYEVVVPSDSDSDESLEVVSYYSEDSDHDDRDSVTSLLNFVDENEDEIIEFVRANP